MSEPLHHIDQLFKDGAGDYSEMPAPANWEQLEQKLDKQTVADLRHKYRYWKRIAAAAILLLSLSAVALLTRQHRSETLPVVKTVPEQPAVQQKTPETGENASKLPEPAVEAPAPSPNQQAADQTLTAGKDKGPLPAVVNNKDLAEQNKVLPKEPKAPVLVTPQEKKDHTTPLEITVNNNRKEKSLPLTVRNLKPATKKNGTAVREDQNDPLLNNPALAQSGSDQEAATAYSARTAFRKADLLQQLRTASLLENTNSATVSGLLPQTKNSLRNVWRNPLHRFAVSAYFSPQKLTASVAEGRKEHREDDHKKIGASEAVQSSMEAGLLLSYRLRSNWQVLTGISYSTQKSIIQPKTVFARRDTGRGRPGNPPPPPGTGDLRYKLNCEAGYVFLDPKTSGTINFGDSLKTLQAENSISYINVPLQTSYLIRKGRFEFGPVAGITVHILGKAKLNTTLEESNGAKTPQTATINGLKKTYLSGMIGAQGVYSFSNRLSVYVLPSTGFSLSPVNQNTPAKTYLRQLGVQTGIRLNL